MGRADAKHSLPVWARGKTVAFHCPKSVITAQSQAFIEKFLYWKRCGGDLWALDAKSADASLALQEEIELEKNDEEQKL
jgi:CYTH domain-containing protein